MRIGFADIFEVGVGEGDPCTVGHHVVFCNDLHQLCNIALSISVGLQLDIGMQVEFCAQGDEFLKSGDLCSGVFCAQPTAEVVLKQLLISESGDFAGSIAGAINGVIVEQHRNAVLGERNIALHISKSHFLRQPIGRECVFGCESTKTPVGHGINLALVGVAKCCDFSAKGGVFTPGTGFVCHPADFRTGRKLGWVLGNLVSKSIQLTGFCFGASGAGSGLSALFGASGLHDGGPWSKAVIDGAVGNCNLNTVNGDLGGPKVETHISCRIGHGIGIQQVSAVDGMGGVCAG